MEKQRTDAAVCSANRITALPVQRDRDGFWTHPLYDQLWREGGDITTEECSAVLAAEHLEWTLVWRDDLARGPDGGFVDLSAWEPERPEGDGWFIASIHETADGVVCVWLRSTVCAAA